MRFQVPCVEEHDLGVKLDALKAVERQRHQARDLRGALVPQPFPPCAVHALIQPEPHRAEQRNRHVPAPGENLPQEHFAPQHPADAKVERRIADAQVAVHRLRAGKEVCPLLHVKAHRLAPAPRKRGEQPPITASGVKNRAGFGKQRRNLFAQPERSRYVRPLRVRAILVAFDCQWRSHQEPPTKSWSVPSLRAVRSRSALET